MKITGSIVRVPEIGLAISNCHGECVWVDAPGAFSPHVGGEERNFAASDPGTKE